MWNMEKITVDGVRVDSYAYSDYHLHRYPANPQTWQISKKNWLGQFEDKGHNMIWEVARERFDDFTRVYITDDWSGR